MAVFNLLYHAGGTPPLPPAFPRGSTASFDPPPLRVPPTIVVAVLAATTTFVGPFFASPDNNKVNWQTLNPEVFKKPFPAFAQQYDAQNPRQVPTATTPHGWEGLQLEYLFKQPFPANSQQFLGYIPEHVPQTLDIEGVYFQSPDLFAKPFPVSAQQFNAFQPQGRINSVFPDGWRNYQFDYGFKPRFPVQDQQFLTHGPEHVPVPIDVEGFYGVQLEYRFAKPVAASVQQFNAFQPAGTLRSIFPDGWRGQQYDIRFAKPFPVSAQQYQIHAPQFLTLLGPTAYLVQDPIALKAPFPAQLQIFSVWDLVGEVPQFFPPGAGRRKDFPSWIPQPPYDARPNKPFRPVWDKARQGEIEQPKPAALPGPPPLPPAGLFAPPAQPADQLNLPSFAHLAPPDTRAFDQQMHNAQDMSDIFTVLRNLDGTRFAPAPQATPLPRAARSQGAPQQQAPRMSDLKAQLEAMGLEFTRGPDGRIAGIKAKS